MAAYQKFQFFVQDLCEAKHNFSVSGGSTFKVLLTNGNPDGSQPAATLHNYSDIAGIELLSGAGYTTGGAPVTITSEAQASGTQKVVASAANPTWTATGNMGPFRYAVVYNATNGGLIALFDYGQTVTLNAADTFTVGFDPSNGLFTVA